MTVRADLYRSQINVPYLRINGDNDTAFGRGSLRYPLLTGRARTFFDFDELGAIQLGLVEDAAFHLYARGAVDYAP